MKRREFIGLLGGGAAAWPLDSRAQQAAKMYVVLWVSTEAQPDPFIEAFRDGMKSQGYVEGRNLAFVLRYAPADVAALRAMLPDLLTTPADLIVSSGPAIQAMRAATDKPVLFAISGDPVALGIVESLARPGRNFTGSTFMSLELAQKRVHLLHELLPKMRTLAVLSNANHPGEQAEHNATTAAAQALGTRLAYAPFASPAELDGALERLRSSGADAMLVYPDGITLVHRAKVAEFAKMHRLPSMLAGANTATPVGWRAMARASARHTAGWPLTPTASCMARARRRCLSSNRRRSSSSSTSRPRGPSAWTFRPPSSRAPPT
jgi:ABC-type uncharacterized transport system substrate-binding protein